MMRNLASYSLSEIRDEVFQYFPAFRNKDLFLRGLNFHRFFLKNPPNLAWRISFCGSQEQLLSAVGQAELQLIGEVQSQNSHGIPCYALKAEGMQFEIEHFRTVELLEDYLNLRPFLFQKALFSLRLNQDVGGYSDEAGLNLESCSDLKACEEDICDLIVVCLGTQKIPSQLLQSKPMPAVQSDSNVLSKLLGEWVFTHRVGLLIDDLMLLKCLPESCDNWLKKALPAIRWYERNQAVIEKVYVQCFESQDIDRSKALFYLCVSSEVDFEVLRWNENEFFAGLVNDSEDWWLAQLQGEKLNTGLVEAWIKKFGVHYLLAMYCSCLISMHKHDGSAWFSKEACLSRMVDLLQKLKHEEIHVEAMLNSYLNEEFHSDVLIGALQASWGGQLRTAKQWLNFLGLN